MKKYGTDGTIYISSLLFEDLYTNEDGVNK